MKKIVAGLALAALVALPGCACRERYSPFLHHVETSLRDSVSPLLRKSLEQSGRAPDLIENDVGEVEDLADACERIRTHGPDAWRAGSQEEAE